MGGTWQLEGVGGIGGLEERQKHLRKQIIQEKNKQNLSTILAGPERLNGLLGYFWCFVCCFSPKIFLVLNMVEKQMILGLISCLEHSILIKFHRYWIARTRWNSYTWTRFIASNIYFTNNNKSWHNFARVLFRHQNLYLAILKMIWQIYENVLYF